jgi:uncharacterized repeat protein (TIGR01451 family)
MNDRVTPRTPRRFARRLVAQLAVVGLVAAAGVALLATGASADSPNPQSASGIADLNGDGSVTLTVSASWEWDTKNCPATDDNRVPGWAVDWKDNQSNVVVDPIYVGTASDNAVHFDAAFNGQDDTYCTSDGSTTNGAFHGTLSHTYSADFIKNNPNIAPCVVTYHLDKTKIGSTGAHSDVAGGATRNTDNSVEENDTTGPDGCLPVQISPDVKIVKTGPTTGTVGVAFSYTLTATNTGLVPAPNTTITDVLPTSLTFSAAQSPCTFNSGTRTVSCNVGTLNGGQSTAVTVTVIPNQAGTIANTATITPNDGTPEDNTSTWTIGNIQAAAEVVSVTPAFTG